MFPQEIRRNPRKGPRKGKQQLSTILKTKIQIKDTQERSFASIKAHADISQINVPHLWH